MSYNRAMTGMWRGPIASRINSSGQAKPKTRSNTLVFSLNLTALIDAFAILVIFLLSNMSSSLQQVDTANKIALPIAKSVESLAEMGLVIRIDSDGYEIDSRRVNSVALVSELVAARKLHGEKMPLVIQADRKQSYVAISNVIKAAASAGFDKYLLAVVPKTQ
jgi:biopolymer transport protein ExbD